MPHLLPADERPPPEGPAGVRIGHVEPADRGTGLIVEYLESLPESGTSLLIAGYPIDVVQTHDNAVKTARIRPDERRPFAESG